MSKKIFQSTKTYDHSVGLSTCFRQWRAESHCQFMHGYALKIKLVFDAQELDHRNWVVDFGGLKEIKQWLQDTFDHKTLVAKDDPKLSTFRQLAFDELIQLVIVDNVGCEAFAGMIYDYVQEWIIIAGDRLADNSLRTSLKYVEVSEHGGNSAVCRKA